MADGTAVLSIIIKAQDDASKILNQVGASMQRFGASVGQQIGKVGAALAAPFQQFGSKAATVFAQATQSVTGFTNFLKGVPNIIRGSTTNIALLAGGVVTLGQNLRASLQNAQAFSGGITQISGALSGIGSFLGQAGLGGIGGVFTKLAGAVGSVLSPTTALIGATAALTAEFVAGTKIAADYDAALRDLTIATGITGDALNRARENAIKFSQDTKFAFGEVVEAFKEIADSRPELIKNADALAAVTEQVLLLAQGTGSDLHDAINITVTAMNQFGLETQDTLKITNTLAAAATAGVAPLSSLGQQLQFVGTVAHASGLTLEQTSAILAEMSLQHIPMRRLSFAMQNFLTASQTGAARLNPAMVGLDTALENLAKEHLSIIEIQAKYGRQSVQFVQALINQREQIKELSVELGQGNAAAEQAAIRGEGLGQTFIRLWNATTNLTSALGRPFVEALQGVIDWNVRATAAVSNFFNALTDPGSQLEKLRELRKNIQATLDVPRVKVLGIQVIGAPDETVARLSKEIVELDAQEKKLVAQQDKTITSTKALAQHQLNLQQASAQVGVILGEDVVKAADAVTEANLEMLESGQRTIEGQKTYNLVQNENILQMKEGTHVQLEFIDGFKDLVLQEKETAVSTASLGKEFGLVSGNISRVTRDALGLDFRKFNDGIRDAIQGMRKLRLEMQEGVQDLDNQLSAFGTRAERTAGTIRQIGETTSRAQQKIGTDAAEPLAKVAHELEVIAERRKAIALLPADDVLPPLKGMKQTLSDALDIDEKRVLAERDRLNWAVQNSQVKQGEVGLLQQAHTAFEAISATESERLATAQNEVDIRKAGVDQLLKEANLALASAANQEQREAGLHRIAALQDQLLGFEREKLQNEIKSLQVLREQATHVKVPVQVKLPTGEVVTQTQIVNATDLVEKYNTLIHQKEQALQISQATNHVEENANAIQQSRFENNARLLTQEEQAAAVQADLSKENINSQIQVLELGLQEERSITVRQDIQRQVINLKKQALGIDIQALQTTIARTQAEIEAGKIAPQNLEATQAALAAEKGRLETLKAGLPILEAQLQHVNDLGKATSEFGRELEDSISGFITGSIFGGDGFGKSEDVLKTFADKGKSILKDMFDTTIKNKLNFEGLVSKNLLTDKDGLTGIFGKAWGAITGGSKTAGDDIAKAVTDGTTQAATAAVDASQVISDAGTNAKGGWADLFGFISDAGSSVFGGLKDAVSGLFSGLKGLGGGGAAAAVPAGAEGTFGVLASDVGPAIGDLTSATTSLASNTADVASSSASMASSASTLASNVAGLAAIAYTLYQSSQALVANRKQFGQVTMGAAGSQSAKNVLTGVQAALYAGGIGVGVGIGAAIGTVIFPGVGTIAGAAVGAAVGAALAKAIGDALQKGVLKGVQTGIEKGMTQKDLDKTVKKNLSSDTLLLALGGPLHLLLTELLASSVTPSIENIFGKIFRKIIGGPGGLSTEGVPVGGGSFYGQPRPVVREARSAARIIAESFGAGGAAYGESRSGAFTSILLGGAAKRAKKTGEDAGKIVAETFVGAFSGVFLAALRVAFRTMRPKKDVEFVSQEFAKGAPAFGLNYRAIAAQAQEEATIPMKKARAASVEAVGKAFQAGLVNAADSTAFRHSMTASVQESFAQGASKALLGGTMGQAFASFFSVSNVPKSAQRKASIEGDKQLVEDLKARGVMNRAELTRAKRRGDTQAEYDILSREFQADVKGFAKIVSDPAFVKAIQDLNDQFLKLQVSVAIASGDLKEAADIIEATLAPAIKTLRDAEQLGRDVSGRAAVAVAGPGLAAARVNVEQLRVRREDVQRRFEARGAKLEDFTRLVNIAQFKEPVDYSVFDLAKHPENKGLISANEQMQENADQLLARFREYAEARLAELEAEIELQRQLVDTLKNAQKAFGDMAKQAKQAATGAPAEYGAAEQAAAFTDVAAKTFILGVKGFEDTEAVNALQEALGEAITEAAARADLAKALSQAFEGMKKSFEDISRSLGQTLGQTDPGTRIKELRKNVTGYQDQIAALLPSAMAGNLGDASKAADLMSKAQADLAEAASIATQKIEFFKEAIKSLNKTIENIDVLLGKVSQQDVFERRMKDLQKALPGALTGNVEDMANAREALDEALSIASSRLQSFKQFVDSFGKTIEDIGVALGKVSQTQLLAKRRGELEAALPKALTGDIEAMAKAQTALSEAVNIASSRLATFKQMVEGFNDFVDQATVARRGRRAQRGIYARDRDEIARLMALARGGDDAALTKLQQLLPSTLALSQQLFRGGRARAAAGELEALGREAAALAENQVTIAEKQLTELERVANLLEKGAKDGVTVSEQQLLELQKIAALLVGGATVGLGISTEDLAALKLAADALAIAAGQLKDAADAEEVKAKKQLEKLAIIADAVSGAAGSELAAANAKLETLKTDMHKFATDMAPIITFLTTQAAGHLQAEYDRVAKLLGEGGSTTDSPLLKVLREVRDRLDLPLTTKPEAKGKQHGGAVEARQAYLVGEAGTELFIPGVGGTIIPHKEMMNMLRDQMQQTVVPPEVMEVMRKQKQQLRAQIGDLARTQATAPDLTGQGANYRTDYGPATVYPEYPEQAATTTTPATTDDAEDAATATTEMSKYMRGTVLPTMGDEFKSLKTLEYVGIVSTIAAINTTAERLIKAQRDRDKIHEELVAQTGPTSGVRREADRVVETKVKESTQQHVGPFTFQFYFPPTLALTRATAEEFGRSSADAFEAKLRQTLRRLEPRKVA